MLREHLIAEVPLAHVSGAVVRVSEHLGQTVEIGTKYHIVVRTTIGMGPVPVINDEREGVQNRMRDVSLLKHA